MTEVTVAPETYNLVEFDSQRIRAVASKLMDEIGVSVPLRIEVDETTPLGRAWMSSLEPLVLSVESGAFEDPCRRSTETTDNTTAPLRACLLRSAPAGRP